MKGVLYYYDSKRDGMDFVFHIKTLPEGYKYEIRTSEFYKRRFEWLYKKLYKVSDGVSSFACLNYIKKKGNAEYIRRVN